MNIIYAILILYGIVCLTFFAILIVKEDYAHFIFTEIFDNKLLDFYGFLKILASILLFPFVCIAFIVIILISPILVFTNKTFQKQIKNEEDSSSKEERPLYQFWMPHDNLLRPDKTQVLYIETSFNPEINNFFEKNLEQVKEIFLTEYNKEWCERGLDFMYLPCAIQEMDFSEFLSYNRPDVPNDTIISKTEILDFIQNKFIKGLYGNYLYEHHPIMGQPVEYCAEGVTINQGFIHYKRTKFEDYLNITVDQYTYFPLEYENDEQFWALIKEYVANTGTTEELASGRNPWPDVPPEYDEEVQQIAKEIQERVKRLQCIGLNNMIINKLVLPEVTLSKLRITKDYKLFLADYKNTEIVMPTLSKTLYFFYLRHPEGVPFKLLDNHKDELFQIYKRVTNRDDIDALRKSIDYLVDPQYNSINEKASRIKTAFVNAFDDNIARNYYISLQDTAVALNRRIALDRNLVIDEAGIVKF